MSDPNKTVFISYRRSASRHLARSIFMDLTQHGYDVFLDVNTIDSGAFDSVILNQIGARTHFVVLLSPTALERCVNEGDWLRREIHQAMQLGRNIVPIIEEGFHFESETEYLPSEWRDQFRRLSGLRLFHDYFEDGMTKLRERFLKPPQFPVAITPVSIQEQREVQQRIEQVKTDTSEKPSQTPQIAIPPKPKIILPQPFDWCYIPQGKVRLLPEKFNHPDFDNSFYLDEPKDFYLSSFWMSKYLITNSQYHMFIEDNNHKYQSPFNNKRTNIHRLLKPQDDYPLVDLTFWDIMKFCEWLSDKTQTLIRLPTEAEWQRAAQGERWSAYPWGSNFDKTKCNTHESGIGKITPVGQYPAGASPFGVMDMAGNVWKWCITEYHTGDNSGGSYGKANYIMRGGSWDDSKTYALNYSRSIGDGTVSRFNAGFFIISEIV